MGFKTAVELVFPRLHGKLVGFMPVPMVMIFLVLEVSTVSNMFCISPVCVLQLLGLSEKDIDSSKNA